MKASDTKCCNFNIWQWYLFLASCMFTAMFHHTRCVLACHIFYFAMWKFLCKLAGFWHLIVALYAHFHDGQKFAYGLGIAIQLIKWYSIFFSVHFHTNVTCCWMEFRPIAKSKVDKKCSEETEKAKEKRSKIC